MDILTILILGVFFIGIVVALYIGIKIGEYKRAREFEKQIPELRSDAIEKSRQVLSGQFSEQLSPYLPDFKYNPSDCRFIGKPIDFIVFNGLANGELKDITFLEVKSGEAKLNSNQRDLKRVIDSGKVKFDEYRIDKNLTRKK
jgi:predicted Holliday junction resolvase-like endonuclease